MGTGASNSCYFIDFNPYNAPPKSFKRAYSSK
jgi:hypothetical protein